MLVYSHEPKIILKESWSSLLQQQQQQEGQTDPPASPTPPVVENPPKEEEIKTPFDNIKLDVLDEQQIAQINAGKAQYIETMKQNRAMSTRIQKVEGVASKYQSEADKLKQQVARLQPQVEAPKATASEKQAREFLSKQGMKSEEIEKQLPFFSGLLEHAVHIAKEEVGRDLGPMAGAVLQQQATSEFTTARGNSQFLQDGEVAQEVWDKFVVPSMQAGQTVSAAAINDYAKIVWVDKAKYQPATPTVPVVPVTPPPQPNPGANFTFPGATVLPPGNWSPTGQNNNPVVSAEVSSAVTAVMSRLTAGTNIWPKGLAKPPGRK